MSNDAFGFGNTPNAVTTRPADSRTFTSADTFGKDCSSSTAQDGTPITAEQFDEIIANLRALLRGNGNLGSGSPVVVENHADAMLLNGVQYLVQRGQLDFALDTGSADALVLSPTPPWLEYKQGMKVRVAKAASPNATQAPSANVSALGARTILRSDGSSIQPGDLPGYGLFELEVDGNLNLRLKALPPAQSRIRLTANTTFYVDASSGNDTSGLGTAAAPWATLQHARNVVQQSYDLGGYGVTFNCAGAFTAGVVAVMPLVGQSSSGGEIWSLTSGSSVSASAASCFIGSTGAVLNVHAPSGVATLAASGTSNTQGCGLFAQYGGFVSLGSGIAFGACAQAPFGTGPLGSISIAGNYAASGNGNTHFFFDSGGTIQVASSGITCTLSGTPAYALGFAYGVSGGTLSAWNMTFAGSGATGKKYNLFSNAVADTDAAGVSYFPGSVSGTNVSGAEYV